MQQFDELRMERRFAANPDLARAECSYLDPQAAGALLCRRLCRRPSRPRRGRNRCFGHRERCWKRRTITSTARFPEPHSATPRRPTSGKQHLEALAAHHRQLEVWAANCPENFENRAALVGAEIARIEGRELDAEHLYEQAIRSAAANGFVHNEALANELAARFYAARGFDQIAHLYLRNARYGYLRWGANGKVRQLDELYPQLQEKEPAPAPTGTIGAPVEHLDLATVLKVSQAVSGEIVLEKLLDTLMRTAIEHAGAQRGLLIAPRGTEQRIEAEATTRGDIVSVVLRDEPVTAAALPESIVHYVVRTREAVILDDASAETPFAADPYLRQHQARSILCLPLINQSKLIGVLYLENNLAPHVFTPARLRGAEAARLAGRDLAGEYPLVPRSRRTRSEDPAPGRRQHHRDLHLGFRRSDSRGQ